MREVLAAGRVRNLFDWVFRNSFGLLAGQAVTAVAILATVSVLSRGLSVSGFAAYAVSQSVLTIIGFFSGCGIPVLLVRDGAGRPASVIGETRTLVLIRAVIMTSVAAVVATWLLLVAREREVVWLWAGASAAGIVTSADPMHLCDAAGVARVQGYALGARHGISAVCIMLGYQLGLRTLQLAELVGVTQVAAAMLYVGIQWWRLRTVISQPTDVPGRRPKELLRRGFPFLALSGASMLLERGDIALAGYRLSPALTADYAAAAQLVIGIRTLVSPLQRTSLAALSASARDSDMAVRQTARALGTVGLVLGILILFAGELAARPAVMAVYGIHFAGSVGVLRVLLLHVATATASFVLGQQLIALGHEAVLQRAILTSTVLAGGLAYLLSGPFGPLGIAISMAASMMLIASWTAVALASRRSSSGRSVCVG